MWASAGPRPPSEGAGGECGPGPAPSPPRCGQFLPPLDSLTHHSHLCLCPPSVFSPCVSLCLILLLGPRPTGLGPALMSASKLDDICQDPISEQGHMHRCWGLGLHLISLGDTIQPRTGTFRGTVSTLEEESLKGRLLVLGGGGPAGSAWAGLRAAQFRSKASSSGPGVSSG